MDTARKAVGYQCPNKPFVKPIAKIANWGNETAKFNYKQASSRSMFESSMQLTTTKK